jgi:hypothetical protein
MHRIRHRSTEIAAFRPAPRRRLLCGLRLLAHHVDRDNAVRAVESGKRNTATDRAAVIARVTGAKNCDLSPTQLAILGLLRDRPQSEIISAAIADKQVAVAILSAPQILSGTSADLRANVEKSYLEHHTANEMAALAEQDEAVKAVETAASLLRTELINAMGMAPSAFEQWMGSAFAPTDAERRAEDVVFVDADAEDLTEAALRLPFDQRKAIYDVLLTRNTDEICGGTGWRAAGAVPSEPRPQ